VLTLDKRREDVAKRLAEFFKHCTEMSGMLVGGASVSSVMVRDAVPVA
jgi:hypothetical protein